jgi:hypothetical protein
MIQLVKRAANVCECHCESCRNLSVFIQIRELNEEDVVALHAS